MVTRYDEKGKYYTKIISKNKCRVIIQTHLHRIHGYLHVREGFRVKDELNEAEKFLAVTDALVYDLNGKLLYRSDFLAINRNHVDWVIPNQDLTESQTPDRGEV